MISFDEALELIRANVTPLGSETVPLDRASGRVLAAPAIARIASPRCDVSAMDGYAVRDADLGSLPKRLKLVGESFAGRGSQVRVNRAQAVRIFTGAPVPPGADRVVIQEQVRREGEWAVIDNHPGNLLYIRKQGSDFSAGEELVPAGRKLDPRAIVAAAGADVSELKVAVKPRVSILSTGDELAEPGTAAGTEDRIPESVSFGVAALADRWGAQVVARTRLADELETMRDAAACALRTSDLVIVTGGASVGEKDFAKPMFEPAGLQLIFSKVAMKPGKPVWLGRAADTLVLGLPGNPTSALVTARLFLAPILAQLTGLPRGALRWRQVPLAHALGPCGERETFHRARLVNGSAHLLSFQDSSAQKALVDAEQLVRQQANTPAMPPGSLVESLDF